MRRVVGTSGALGVIAGTAVLAALLVALAMPAWRRRPGAPRGDLRRDPGSVHVHPERGQPGQVR